MKSLLKSFCFLDSSEKPVILSPKRRSLEGTKDLISLFRSFIFLPLFFLSLFSLSLVGCGTDNSSSEQLNSIMTLRRYLATVPTALSGTLSVYDEDGQEVASRTLSFVEQEDGSVSVMVSNITLLQSTTYRFVIIFYWEGVAIAYVDTTQTTSDEDETLITYAEGDIVYGVPGDLSESEAAEFAADVSDGILPDLDSDDDGYSNFVELGSESDPDNAESVPSSPDIDGDGYPADAGDCDDNDALVYPGATEYLNLVDENCDGETSALLLSQVSIAITGSSQNEKVGMGVINGGDINNDGIEDLVISNAMGQVHIFYGKTSWENTTSSSSDVVLYGETTNGDGLNLAGKADVDADGCDDLLIGDAAYATNTGRAYLVYGHGSGCNNTSALSGSLSLSNVGGSLDGASFDAENSTDRAGCSVSLTQNYNGDAFADLLIGACTNDASGTDSGKGYLVFGGDSVAGAGERSYNDLTGTLSLYDVAVHSDSTLYGNDFVGPPTEDMITTGLSFIGNTTGVDPSGGSYDDFAYGSLLDDGWAIFYAGGELGSSYGRIDQTMSSTGDGEFSLDAYDGGFGSVIAALGDINGDGYDDFAIASPYGDYTGSDTGRIKIYYGPPSVVGGSVSPDAILDGDQINGHLGQALGAHGADVNGDGVDDFVVSAPGWIDSSLTMVGRTYLIFGGDVPTGEVNINSLSSERHIIITGTDMFGESGFSVALGDFNGDGLVDLAIAAPVVSSSKGRVYLVLGR